MSSVFLYSICYFYIVGATSAGEGIGSGASTGAIGTGVAITAGAASHGDAPWVVSTSGTGVAGCSGSFSSSTPCPSLADISASTNSLFLPYFFAEYSLSIGTIFLF